MNSIHSVISPTKRAQRLTHSHPSPRMSIAPSELIMFASYTFSFRVNLDQPAALAKNYMGFPLSPILFGSDTGKIAKILAKIREAAYVAKISHVRPPARRGHQTNPVQVCRHSTNGQSLGVQLPPPSPRRGRAARHQIGRAHV